VEKTVTKKEMLRKILGPVVLDALSDTYKINTSSPSDKQLALIDAITELLYPKIDSKLGVKDFKDILGDDNEDLSNSV
jgi:hypothetical protein